MNEVGQLSLARQMDIVFKEMDHELAGLSSGIVFVQIRNNVVGKFGIRHNPIAGKGGKFAEVEPGLSAQHREEFRRMALETLNHKRSWTHGEIAFDFAIRQGTILVDATLESNYNMANLMIRYNKPTYRAAKSE
ncbi:O-methyltransferase [Paenibacillus sp. CMAA1739]|uniref:O-methyltransferase n=1 Tax=Paenibacillus ottowii TaxID=2315729 RepID=UPI00272F0A77|nr:MULTISPECIES: O-methyltransferase [Paenibacillus]MDP1511604.1 O-methyltransferase [Paenibacillus ottowii]MEC4567902.1 O-methyltransferase [Paenibacillus sp. CMAA1739]